MNALAGPDERPLCIESLTEASNRKTTMSEITLNIEGMHCGACVRRVTQTLQRVPGAEVEEVRIGAARIKAEEAAPLVAALAKAGYTARAEQP